MSTSNDVDLLEQNIWTLGNITGDSFQNRDSKSLVSNVAWVIKNLCRGVPRTEFRLVKPLLPSIKKADVISEALWALSCLTESTNEEHEIFDNIISMGLVEVIIEIIFESDQKDCIKYGFNTIGNMLSGFYDVIEYLLQCNVLKVFPKILSSPSEALVT
ncbi:hypothetical protein ACTFIT_002790 [Dictyostelium discoideum]